MRMCSAVPAISTTNSKRPKFDHGNTNSSGAPKQGHAGPQGIPILCSTPIRQIEHVQYDGRKAHLQHSPDLPRRHLPLLAVHEAGLLPAESWPKPAHKSDGFKGVELQSSTPDACQFSRRKISFPTLPADLGQLVCHREGAEALGDLTHSARHGYSDGPFIPPS